MNFTLPKGYLSASSIKTFLTCPKQYEFRYIHGKVIPPNAALAVGSVAHKTLQTYYNDVIDGGTRLTQKQVGELSKDTLADWLSDNDNTVTTAEANEANTLLPVIIENYVDKIGQNIDPLNTEVETRFTTPEGVPLLGYIDLLFNDDNSNAIADYKITSKKLTTSDLINSLQFNLYAIMTGIGNIQIHNIVKTKPKPSKQSSDKNITDFGSGLRKITHKFTGEQVDHFNELVFGVAKLISAGTFIPCAPDSWCCNENWCGYWKLCRGKA